MAGYTITRSDGLTTLSTIQDGTINTTSTSLALPGRNYPGYGNAMNTNFVKLVENFASPSVPANPIRGQLWFNVSSNTLNYCTQDGTTLASNWVTLTTTSSAGDTNLGNLRVSSNTITDNLVVNNATTSNTISVVTATVSGNLTVGTNANLQVANIGTTNTRVITTGNITTAGTLTGNWTLNGNLNGGNLFPSVIKANTFLNASGVDITTVITGTYSNTNVSSYLTDTSSVTGFRGAIFPSSVTTSLLAGGGNITGIWTVPSGSKIQANYADLAERFEADELYDAGTVVEIGGDKEITAVKSELSDDVFGVISDTAGFTMNNGAGDDETHPTIAMSGRVQVKVIGKVKKGDRLVSSGIKGYARSAKKDEMTAFNVIGRALEHKSDIKSGTVLAVVAITK
jgi:hypothetical protein